MLTAFLLSYYIFQDPNVPEKPEPAPPPLLMRVLHPTLTGLEKGPEPRSRGWIKTQPILAGKWLQVRYHQVWEDETVEPHLMTQIMKQGENNEIEAWQFDAKGDFSKWSGQISKRGMVLETLSKGVVVGRQVYEWDQGGFHFRLLGPGKAEEKLVEWFHAHYQPTSAWEEPKLNPKFQTEVKEIPYSWYLGEFSGKELSVFGPTTAYMKTTLGPGPWFTSNYETKATGAMVFSGMGFVSAKKNGSYDLYWFESSGGHQKMSGLLDNSGTAIVEMKNEKGQVIERHMDQRQDKNHYTFTIEQLNLETQEWSPFMTGEYVRKTD
ncbi:MAG TPA: hypothetical protein QGG59_09540 [Planctomycetota bacterium]|nr:hypothetical protein [Planctomycetota bacterium]